MTLSFATMTKQVSFDQIKGTSTLNDRRNALRFLDRGRGIDGFFRKGNDRPGRPDRPSEDEY